jgi:hypothetical protein
MENGQKTVTFPDKKSISSPVRAVTEDVAVSTASPESSKDHARKDKSSLNADEQYSKVANEATHPPSEKGAGIAEDKPVPKSKTISTKRPEREYEEKRDSEHGPLASPSVTGTSVEAKKSTSLNIREPNRMVGVDQPANEQTENESPSGAHPIVSESPVDDLMERRSSTSGAKRQAEADELVSRKRQRPEELVSDVGPVLSSKPKPRKPPQVVRSPRVDLDRIKLLLYSAGFRVHGGQRYDKLFSNYWDAISASLEGPLPDSMSRQVITSFLKTRALRKLHNKLIMGKSFVSSLL